MSVRDRRNVFIYKKDRYIYRERVRERERERERERDESIHERDSAPITGIF